MTYHVDISKKAEKKLAKFQKRDSERIIKEMEKLADDPRPRWTKKLCTMPGLRIDVGDFRVIFAVDDNKKNVYILDVDDRKDIYR